MLVFGHAGSPAVRRGAGLLGDVVWVLSWWLRGLDLNQRPSGYEPDELPDCSTPRHLFVAPQAPATASAVLAFLA